MDLQARLPWGDLVIAAVAGAAGVAGSFLLAGPTEGFVVVPVNAFVVDNMPDVILTLSIVYLGKLGELIGFALATATVVALLGAAAAAAGRVGAIDHPAKVGAVTAAWCAGIAFLLAGARDPALVAGVAAGAVAGALDYHDRPGFDPESRRKALVALGGVAGFGVVSYLLGTRAHGKATRDLAETTGWDDQRAATVRREIRSALAEAEERSLDVDGLGGLVTPIAEHYEVDINYLDPKLDPSGWELSVTGEVAEEFSVTYDEIVGMEPEHRFITLRCVSDPVNGDLIGTALWTGIPIERLLDRAEPQGNFVVLRSQDDYYVEVPIEAIEGGFLAYGMNGSALPADHGYPLRAHVLGHYGEVNAKWLTEIDVTQSEVVGYWEKRGWQGTGPVNTVAKIDTVNKFDDGRARIAGHAYAGLDDIRAVEVSTDGGETWAEARLGDPLPGRDTWRQWVHEWTPPSERRRVFARVVHGDGSVQTREKQTPQPSGATGWANTFVEGN
ncbi:MAG: molybdopterin-dependent oxidoreductase [Haloferacaceae archaeon]